jgi:hypothetical protein
MIKDKKLNKETMSINLPYITIGGIDNNESETPYCKDDLHNVKNKIVAIVESYLKDNLWVDHVFENGYPVKAMTKSDFLGMLNQIKLTKI